MENIGGGMTALAIWLGRRLEKKTAQKISAAMSFSFFFFKF
jgi:hypothetical protein